MIKGRLVAAGMEEAPIDMSEAEARALARKNGYGLVELLRGALNMDGVLGTFALGTQLLECDALRL